METCMHALMDWMDTQGIKTVAIVTVFMPCVQWLSPTMTSCNSGQAQQIPFPSNFPLQAMPTLPMLDALSKTTGRPSHATEGVFV